MTTDPTMKDEASVMRPVRRANAEYRVREHLTESEIAKLLAALKGNRHGHRDWLIGLMIYRHGLRVSEACYLRWDDIDLASRTIVIRRLNGSRDRLTTWSGMSCGGSGDCLISRLMSSSTNVVHPLGGWASPG
jgi:integrase